MMNTHMKKNRVESNASIRNTRKGLQSQMILGLKRGKVCRKTSPEPFAFLTVCLKHLRSRSIRLTFRKMPNKIFVAFCWTNEIKRYK
jgi:hypothetical protein